MEIRYGSAESHDFESLRRTPQNCCRSVPDFPIGGRLRIGIMDQRKIVSAAAKAVAAKVDAVVIAAGFDPGSESEARTAPSAFPSVRKN